MSASVYCMVCCEVNTLEETIENKGRLAYWQAHYRRACLYLEHGPVTFYPLGSQPNSGTIEHASFLTYAETQAWEREGLTFATPPGDAFEMVGCAKLMLTLCKQFPEGTRFRFGVDMVRMSTAALIIQEVQKQAGDNTVILVTGEERVDVHENSTSEAQQKAQARIRELGIDAYQQEKLNKLRSLGLIT